MNRIKGWADGVALVFAVLTIAPAASAATLSCAQSTLQEVAPSDTTITGANHFAANPPTPGFCDVTGFVTTTDPGPNHVGFELALPDLPSSGVVGYNGRFAFLGNGGFAGTIQESPSLGVPFGFATAATDTGHQGVELDGSWALNNPAKQLDYGSRGVHVTAHAAQALTQSFYDATSVRHYFFGCSDGGREGMVEAETYPTDFDGIMAGDPAIGNEIAGYNWNQEALFRTVHSWIPSDKLDLLDNAVLASCDGADGVIDGLIQDPRKCTFNPGVLACPSSDPDPDTDSLCLSIDQVKMVRAIYSGAMDKRGKHIYPGFTKSDPSGTDGWGGWITGFTTPTISAFEPSEPWGDPPASFATAPMQWSFQDQYLKYFLFADPSFNSLNFSFNNHTSDDVSKLVASEDLGGGDGDNPDLSAFRAAGGKLLMYHGWSDPAVTPLESVAYYRSAIAKFGGDLTKVRNFARLFMVPGMHHCGGGPGPNVFDAMVPLVLWVELGLKPDSIIASHFNNNDPTSFVDRTMPLCAFPEVAVFKGGNKFTASSWKCEIR